MVRDALLQRFLMYDSAALDELESLCSVDQQDCCDTIWAFLDSAGSDGRHVVGGFCEKAVQLLVTVLGKSGLEEILQQIWSSLHSQGRENISANVFCDPTLLSTELALKLVSSPASSGNNKIDIISNLIQHRDDRHIDRTTLTSLMDNLVSSGDIENQETIQNFIDAVRDDLDYSG